MPVSLELLRNLGRTCGFPPEATTAQVEAASVLLTVRVAADGKIVSVSVISERPAGYGFGARAKRCIQRAQFQAALDVAGHPVVSNTPPITFNFELQ
jgi:TonB family protein